METFPYTCPFCQKPSIVTQLSICSARNDLTLANAEGLRSLTSSFIVCPNPECRRFSLTAQLHELTPRSGGGYTLFPTLQSWNLVPPSKAKPFPEYIPQAIRQDYKEARLIEQGSPKAAATLARRCLQGMIRDFWRISEKMLSPAIQALEGKIDPLTWQAIDAVRKIGNIGAHMEADINTIVDVEPEEAAKLLWLIELLLRDWYITRHEREEGLKEISAVAADKDAKKKPIADS